MNGRSLPVLLLALTLFLPAALHSGPPPGSSDPDLARAQELIDAEQGAAAAKILDKILERRPEDAEALFLRSTARFVEGDTLRGRWDLEKSLKLDPGRRQAWLNLGALNLAEGHLDTALDAFLKAQALDPQAVDVELNIGAVLLFQGKLKPASQHFERYLAAVEDGAEPYYLVASNYAIAGYAALAVEHLKQAIQREERYRLRARTDPAFGTLGENPALMRVLNQDSYRPPPGSYEASQEFRTPYEATDARLLGAVIDALRELGVTFDPRVEVTPGWALIWGEVRIKVSPSDQGAGGRVSVTAPADRLGPEAWRRLTVSLFEQIAEELGERLKPRQP